jgi:hypothetical protein
MQSGSECGKPGPQGNALVKEKRDKGKGIRIKR